MLLESAILVFTGLRSSVVELWASSGVARSAIVLYRLK